MLCEKRSTVVRTPHTICVATFVAQRLSARAIPGLYHRPAQPCRNYPPTVTTTATAIPSPTRTENYRLRLQENKTISEWTTRLRCFSGNLWRS